MKELILNKKSKILEFSESKISSKDITTINKFKKLVIEKGDNGLRNISKILKEKEIKSFKVSNSEFKKAEQLVDDQLKNAILTAYSNIKMYHEKQLDGLSVNKVETTKGVSLWSEFKPIDSVGLYIPGGTAPLFSSLLMQAIPAIIADCPNIVICTPPDTNGKINPTILWVADLLNIKNVYKVGGSQAIFAMAYGTESIPKCYKIFGPGNKYVTEAKLQVSKDISIDMPAGPSEVYVVSNDIEKADIIASDLLSQLEHSIDAKAVLISKNKKLLKDIKTTISNQKESLSRQSILNESIKNTYLVKAKNDKEIINFINDKYQEIVKDGMREAVLRGTTKGLNRSNLTVAAKTGTAELGAIKSNVNSWVIGYFPYEDPKYIFTVMMEKGPRDNYLGGVFIMSQFIDWMLLNKGEYFR